MAEFIDVFSKRTGRKHRVPAHFMDDEVLSKPFRKTPKQRKADTESATPVTDVVTATSDQPSTTDTPAAGD